MKTIILTDEQLEALIECVKRDCEPTKEDLKALEDALANLRVAAEHKDNINKFGVNPTIE